MIHYGPCTISEEFAGIGKPSMWTVRRLAPNGVTGIAMLGSYPSIEQAKLAIDQAAAR